MTKKKVGAIAVIAFVGALGFVSFNVGLLAGEAHKTIEKRLAFKKGFEKGKSCKIGALGVPLGTKCEVFGWLDRPSPPLTKRDDADNVFYRALPRRLLNPPILVRFNMQHAVADDIIYPFHMHTNNCCDHASHHRK